MHQSTIVPKLSWSLCIGYIHVHACITHRAECITHRAIHLGRTSGCGRPTDADAEAFAAQFLTHTLNGQKMMPAVQMTFEVPVLKVTERDFMRNLFVSTGGASSQAEVKGGAASAGESTGWSKWLLAEKFFTMVINRWKEEESQQDHEGKVVHEAGAPASESGMLGQEEPPSTEQHSGMLRQLMKYLRRDSEPVTSGGEMGGPVDGRTIGADGAEEKPRAEQNLVPHRNPLLYAGAFLFFWRLLSNVQTDVLFEKRKSQGKVA